MNRRTLVFAATALIASARGASAHARLRSASPAAGERLAAAPKEVSIVFSEALEPKFSTIDVHNAAGAGPVRPPPSLIAGLNVAPEQPRL